MSNAFHKQLTELVPVLRNYSRRYCKSDADAADLVQKTLERALTYEKSYQMGTNMKAWASRIMHNTYINEWRRRQRHNKVMEKAGHEPREPQAKPDANDGSREALARLELLKANMPVDYYTMVEMCDYQGKSYKECAAELDIPIGTVMSRLHRGRKRARDILLRNYSVELLTDMMHLTKAL